MLPHIFFADAHIVVVCISLPGILRRGNIPTGYLRAAGSIYL
jgi:hypothetical protein